MARKTSERKVLYLEYRPQVFADIIGQDNIRKTLLSALLSNQVSHAYLFSGPRGTGKTTVARILAKAVNCSQLKNGSPREITQSGSDKVAISQGEPCNKCESCLEITSGRSLDVIEIDAASNRGIDEIRELRDKIRFSPAKRRYKVFIIDEVHMLTREAFNALLKTLEEPPAHALFILATTEIHKVPETILSRCQRFDFCRIKMTDLVKYLNKVSKKEKLEIEKGGLELIAANAGGALRDAVNLLDQASSFGKKITLSSLQTILGLTNDEAAYKLIDFLIEKEITKPIELINELLERGCDLTSFCKKLIEHLRHILILKVSQKEELIEVTAEQLERIKKQVRKLEIGQLIKMIEIFLETEKKIALSNLPQLPLEIAILEINENEFGNYNKEIIPASFRENKNGKTKSSKNKSSDKSDEFKKIIEEWDPILKQTKLYNHSISAFLRACQPAELKDGTLYLDFFYKFHKERINEPKNRDIVEHSIKKVTGKFYKIKCQFNARNKKEKDKKEEKDKELLKTALEVFGGEIVE
jgi:DNA polymerase III subunit gamma/tau